MAIAVAACAALAAGCGSGSDSGSQKASICSHPPTTQAGAPSGTAAGATRWPAPPNPMKRACQAGLTPEPAEQLAYHVHAHLDVYVNAKHEIVPGAIGIDVADPAVHKFDEPDGTIGYGGIDPPCADPCISPLHTHSDDGVLHTESPVTRLNRLGQFFTEWNVRLDRRCVDGYCRPKTPVAVYVDGSRYTGDPRQILLTDLKEIAVVVGKPPPTIPTHFPTG